MKPNHQPGEETAHFPGTAQKRRNVAAAWGQAMRCSSIAQVQAAVAQARQSAGPCVVRCGGNLAASATAAFDASTQLRLVLEGALASVTLESTHADGTKTFRVGAGCLIGHDPTNPISRPESSLMAQLVAAGCALPLVGGSSNMTLGGYFMTGSDGGSIRHALSHCIQSS